MADDPARKPRGRPPLDPHDRTVPVSVALPSRLYDAVCRVAHRHDISPAEVIRRQLRRRGELGPDRE